MKKLLMIFAVVFASNFSLADDSKADLTPDFGGKPGLVKIVDDFMLGLLAESKTKASFINADQKHIKEMLVEQFCDALGGPCKYTGKSMEKSHAGLDIKKSEFNALVECLRTAMDKNHVPARSQNKLLAALAPMHKDIVGK